MLDPEKIGFVLWEGITLLVVILSGLGLLVLRRKFSGKPAFTNEDWQLFFGHSKIRLSSSTLLLNFGITVFLCLFIAILETRIFEPLGAGPLTVLLLLTSLGIVKKLLF
jgi:hypothetical protein